MFVQHLLDRSCLWKTDIEYFTQRWPTTNKLSFIMKTIIIFKSLSLNLILAYYRQTDEQSGQSRLNLDHSCTIVHYCALALPTDSSLQQILLFIFETSRE